VRRTAEKDAEACAYYLAELRGDRQRGRFKAVVEDFLERHKDKGLSASTLRLILAIAYADAAPSDNEGRLLISGPKQ
jgi:hypothetical protein